MRKKGSSPSSTPAAKESVVSRQPCPNHGSAPAPQAACVPPPRNSRCQDCLFFPRQLYTYSVPFIESLVLTAWMMMLMLMIVVVMIRTPLHPLMEYAVYVLTSAACVSLGNTQAQSWPSPTSLLCASVSVCTLLCMRRIHILYTAPDSTYTHSALPSISALRGSWINRLNMSSHTDQRATVHRLKGPVCTYRVPTTN